MFRAFDAEAAVSQGEGKSIFHWKFLSVRCWEALETWSELWAGKCSVAQNPVLTFKIWLWINTIQYLQAELSQFLEAFLLDEYLITSYFDVHLGYRIRTGFEPIPIQRNIPKACIPSLTMPELKCIRLSSVFLECLIPQWQLLNMFILALFWRELLTLLVSCNRCSSSLRSLPEVELSLRTH